eukprot:TRINITY_DN11502_c0_g1_i1.p1 TRINITY_DN11502_c0_g1~~TRINITY_DN11502_c0_g1_i1.p1  ORF type:complete len:915 (+),score=243.51 TRINITY_DN11502_c0_g1_i1:144-2888(+)
MDRYRRDDFGSYPQPGIMRATMAAPVEYGRYDYPNRPDDRYHRPRMSYYREENATARMPSAPTERNPESSERYVKLLERDIESLREELKAARERADNPELLRELRSVQDNLREETRKVHDLEGKLHESEDLAVRFNSLQAEYSQVREDLRRAQLDITQLERDLHHTQDGARSAEQREAAIAEQIVHYKEELHGVRTELVESQQKATLAARQHLHDMETAALQHSRELTAAQNETVSCRNELRNKEQEVKARQQTIESLEERLRKEVDHNKELRGSHDRVLAELKEAKNSLESDLRSTMQQVGTTTSQLARKDEMIGLLEAESANKAERIAQQEEQLSSLREECSSLSAKLATAQADAERNGNQLEDLEAQLATSEALRKEADERETKTQEQFDELAVAIQATEAQRRAGLVLTRANEVMDHVAQLENQLAEAKSELDTLALESSSKTGKIETLEADLAKAHDARGSADEQVTSLREELLTRTRELKDLTLAHEALHREQRQACDKLSRVEEVLAQKEDHIEELRKQVSLTRTSGADKADELRKAVADAEAGHQQEVIHLQKEMARLQDQNATEKQYADVCRRLGRLLNIDPNMPAGTHSDRIYDTVADLTQKAQQVDELRRSQHMQTTLYPPPSRHGLQETAQFQGYPQEADAMRSSLATLAVLRKEVEAKENEAAESKIQLEAFIRDVGRAVDASDIHDAEAVLDAVKDAMRTRKSAHPPRNPPSSRTTRRRGYSGTGSMHKTSKHDEEDYQKVKKKLTTALKTIESQDMWIDVLNRKLESSTSGASDIVQTEMRRLEDQVAYLKQQLSARDASRPGTAMPAYQGVINGAGAADILAFKSTISDLEARLQKHIEFRERVIQALQLSVISAPDEEILRAIHQAVGARGHGFEPLKDSGLQTSYTSHMRTAPVRY